MKKYKLSVFENEQSIANALADLLKDIINKKTCHIALSGGSTPKLLYKTLAKEYKHSVNWENAHFYWGDERCVRPDHFDSNFLMAQEALLNHVPVPRRNIFRIKGENNPEQEAKTYSEILKQNLDFKDGWPVFDLVLLGIGADGHTASIFPNQMNLLKSNKYCEVAEHPETQQKRVTLTGQVINHADRVVFIVAGDSKTKIVSSILHKTEEALTYPASHIQPVSGHLHWYMDIKAASQIK